MKRTQITYTARFIYAPILLALTIVSSSIFAQSSDRDHPRPLSSAETKGEIDASGEEAFYSFNAGPGELTITIDVSSSDGTTSLEFELLDRDAAHSLLCCEFAQADSTGETGRNVKHIKLGKYQTVVLHLTQGKTGRGTFRVRLSGAVEFKSHSDQ